MWSQSCSGGRYVVLKDRKRDGFTLHSEWLGVAGIKVVRDAQQQLEQWNSGQDVAKAYDSSTRMRFG